MLLSVFSPSMAYAIDYFADALYWQASETVDWSLTNDLNLPNQNIAYNTIAFHFSPGFRVGAGFQNERWGGRLVYTDFRTHENASVSNHVVSAFMPSKFAEAFYQSGQVDFKVTLHMLDLDVYQPISVGETLVFYPLVGLKAGTIYQRIDAQFQGAFHVLEHVSNDFSGIGTKVGVEANGLFYRRNGLDYRWVTALSSAFMWGNWSITDEMRQSNASALSSVDVGKRQMGAFQLQGLIGVQFQYKQGILKLGYEVSDWFNQYQVFDDGTGTHTNDLVLQGFTLALSVRG